jgi:hypothetical protein
VSFTFESTGHSQPVFLGSTGEFPDIASQVVLQGIKSPTNVAPLLLGHCSQLPERFIFNLQPVTHNKFFPNRGYY